MRHVCIDEVLMMEVRRRQPRWDARLARALV